MANLDGVAYGLIHARRQHSLDGADLLGWLLRGQSDLAWLTDRLVRDNVVTLLVDSRENPALLLTWTLYLLARHPDVADRLATEIETTQRSREPGATDLPRLLLADAVLRETLRLYPPVYSTGREATRDCTVAGIAVKRGTVVLLSQAVTHRDAGRFPDPDAFRPERWRDPAIGSLPTGAFAPFHFGPRRCLSEHLAWTIGLVGLAMLARDRRYVAIDGQPVEPKVLLSLRPSREVKLRVEGR